MLFKLPSQSLGKPGNFLLGFLVINFFVKGRWGWGTLAVGEGHERLGSQLPAQRVTAAECRVWSGKGGTWTKCSQKSQCFAVQCSAHSFPLILLSSQDQILEHQVPWGINNLLFLITLQELYSSCLAAQTPLFQSFLLILVSGKMGMGVEGRCLSQHHNRRSPFSLASWKWVCAWLVAMHLWVGHYVSLLSWTHDFKVCLGLFWKTWMQLSQISTQICSFGLACNELNFILPVLHSQLATQNLNSLNNSPNHPIRLIIKA